MLNNNDTQIIQYLANNPNTDRNTVLRALGLTPSYRSLFTFVIPMCPRDAYRCSESLVNRGLIHVTGKRGNTDLFSVTPWAMQTYGW